MGDSEITMPQSDIPELSVVVPQIIQTSTNLSSEVELKNLDSWNLTSFDLEDHQKTQDSTWAQFRNKDIQNKQRVIINLI